MDVVERVWDQECQFALPVSSAPRLTLPSRVLSILVYGNGNPSCPIRVRLHSAIYITRPKPCHLINLPPAERARAGCWTAPKAIFISRMQPPPQSSTGIYSIFDISPALSRPVLLSLPSLPQSFSLVCVSLSLMVAAFDSLSPTHRQILEILKHGINPVLLILHNSSL